MTISGTVIDGFAVSARNAVEAGFDGIEIKVAHDGLLRSFASPFFNHRVDRYGGSFENRMRLSLEVLEAIKKETGAAYPVGVRICLNEFTTFGYGLDYGTEDGGNLEIERPCRLFQCRRGFILELLDGDTACGRSLRRLSEAQCGAEAWLAGFPLWPSVASLRLSAPRICCAPARPI